MSFEPLIHSYLDGVLTEEQEAELNAWIKAAPENAVEFAELVRFHDRLHGTFQATPSGTGTSTTPVTPTRVTQSTRLARPRHRLGLISGVAALSVLVLVLVWSLNPPVASASTELDRLIDAANHSTTRVYRITSLDPNPLPVEPRQAPIDGAMLYVGPSECYVLVRHFPDGREYTTGFDGERNWAAPPDGAVRISRDPFRFRWPLPGHQHGIPFVNLRSDLVQLRDAYVISPLASDLDGNRGLLAMKKSSDHRGPNRVELWYDPSTLVIRRMVFSGLPLARGGPDRVSVELVEHRELGSDFFQHSKHHAPSRRVVEED